MIGCGVLNLTLAYYLLFLERDYPVSKLGASRERVDAIRDPSFPSGPDEKH